MIVRHKLLADLVRLWKNDQLIEKIDRLPVELSPRRSKPMGRCCIHKERAVWRYKTFPLMGLDMTDEHEEEFGNDPIVIYQGDMWLGGKFLNIIFHQYLPRSEKHRISLVQNKIEPEAPETPEALNVDEDGYIHLELRYNTYDDVTGYRGWGRVSYNLEEFYPTAKDAAETEFKGFKVTINSKENGEGRVIVLDLDHPVGVPEKAKDVHSTSFVK